MGRKISFLPILLLKSCKSLSSYKNHRLCRRQPYVLESRVLSFESGEHVAERVYVGGAARYDVVFVITVCGDYRSQAAIFLQVFKHGVGVGRHLKHGHGQSVRPRLRPRASVDGLDLGMLELHGVSCDDIPSR